jgi:RNA polymerase sigma-70 factor (ECF subfamily)
MQDRRRRCGKKRAHVFLHDATFADSVTLLWKEDCKHMNRLKQQRFLEFLAPVSTKLSSYCLAMTRDSEAAYDLMGDTILAAYESFEKLKDDRAFTAFLFTIARRKYWRRRLRSALFGTYESAIAEQIDDPTVRPWISVDIQALYDAIAQLPAKQREAVIMFELSGCSLEEIRQVQGGSISAVKSRLSRGRQRLSRILGVDNEVAGLNTVTPHQGQSSLNPDAPGTPPDNASFSTANTPA